MAQVKKMMIQGIRSFSPEDDKGQVIEFFSPMTLIVGSNGCGKTTIIEAMKYGITGLFPPNTKHGGFINDPKLGTGAETRAMVKVELLDKKADRLVVTRRLKATTTGKQGNVSMAKVEHTVAHFVTKSDGTIKKHQMSSKCVDIEEMVNRVIGVSEPILNNVIFCHQEDSCWPLDEASKVKTKFDAIFNTTVYIKALKTFQDREKAMAHDIKMTKQSFDHTEENLTEARKKNSRLDDEKTALKSMNDEIAEHEKKIAEGSQKFKSLEELSQNYAKKQCYVAGKKGEINELEKSIRECRKRIQEPFKADLDSLQQKIDQFAFAYNQQCEALSNTRQEKRDAEDKRKRLNDRNQKFVIQKGIFEKEKKVNDGKIEEMGGIMEDLRSYIRSLKESSQSQGEYFSVSLDSVLMSLDVDLESVDAATAVKALESAVASKVSDYEKLKTKFESEETKLQQKNLELGKSEQNILTQINGKETSEMDLKKKIEALRKRLDDLDKSNDKLVELIDKEQAIQDTIDRMEKSELNKNFEAEIAALEQNTEEMERKRAILQEQNRLLSTDSTFVVRIKSAQEQRAKKEKECSGILRRIEPHLRSLVTNSDSIPDENLNPFVQDIVNKLNIEVDEKTKEMNRIKIETAKAETQKKQIGRELDKKQKEISQIVQKTESVMQGASFIEEYSNIFRETEEAQAQVSQNESASFLYKQYVQKLEKKPCCPLCKRDFAKEAENKALIQNLTKMLKSMELNKPEQEEKLDELKARQEELVKLKPHYDMKEKLERELPELFQKKQGYEAQIKSFEDTVAELTDTLSVLTIDKSSATSLLKDTIHFDKNQADKKLQEAEVKKLDSARDPKAKELTVTLSDVQTELENVESTISTRRREKDRKKKMLDDNIAKLTKAKGELNQIVKAKLDITGDLQNQDVMEKQKREYEGESLTLKTAIQELKKQLPNIRADVGRLAKEISILKQSHSAQLAEVQKERDDLLRQKERVGKLDKEIKAFRQQCLKFEAEAEAHKEIEDELKACQQKLKELDDEIEILTTEVQCQEGKKRDLEDNKLLKLKELERDKLVAEIETDSKLIETSKIRGLQAQMNDEQNKLKKITERKDQAIGSRRTVRDNISLLEEEMRDPKYAEAEVRHRKDMIKHMVLVRAQKDIRLYRVALDSAVMTFHRKKMELINKYLKYYWKKIYRGNDIDYIEIKTDNEEAAIQKTAKLDMSRIQRKNYNYRVVAYRRGIELDMRGRCSAGQKVLASIIIRLSLAQTFTEHCGIITLDEPTTNLDRENIQSLASTLCDLALNMRGIKTFQLVVITHDQQFINSLLQIDPIDFYFKIRRDNLGYSMIEKVGK